jgi:methylglutaconyl-CoA hydratase
MGYQTLTYQCDGQVATIALTVPEKRNAISERMIADLLGALDQAEKERVRVVILTGSGKAFCAGMDLEELRHIAHQPQYANLENARRISRLFYRLYSFPKPIVAAVNGAAIAGGSGIATLADFTLAVPEAKFGYTEVRIGFMPALVSVFLRRQVGEKHARDLLLSGRIFDAAEAYRLGLVTEIVPAETLMARAREIAANLLAASPTSIVRAKKFLLRFDDAAVRAELEAASEANAEIRSTHDFREGLTSFLERRAPQWRGDDSPDE